MDLLFDSSYLLVYLKILLEGSSLASIRDEKVSYMKLRKRITTGCIGKSLYSTEPIMMYKMMFIERPS